MEIIIRGSRIVTEEGVRSFGFDKYSLLTVAFRGMNSSSFRSFKLFSDGFCVD
jgi:hypothetical protein